MLSRELNEWNMEYRGCFQMVYLPRAIDSFSYQKFLYLLFSFPKFFLIGPFPQQLQELENAHTWPPEQNTWATQGRIVPPKGPVLLCCVTALAGKDSDSDRRLCCVHGAQQKQTFRVKGPKQTLPAPVCAALLLVLIVLLQHRAQQAAHSVSNHCSSSVHVAGKELHQGIFLEAF